MVPGWWQPQSVELIIIMMGFVLMKIQAIITFASLWVVALEVPVERLADVADAAGDLLLAGAERPLGHDVAAAQLEEVLRHSGRVAVALLAQRVVVPLGRALVALDNINEIS